MRSHGSPAVNSLLAYSLICRPATNPGLSGVRPSLWDRAVLQDERLNVLVLGYFILLLLLCKTGALCWGVGGGGDTCWNTASNVLAHWHTHKYLVTLDSVALVEGHQGPVCAG